MGKELVMTPRKRKPDGFEEKLKARMIEASENYDEEFNALKPSQGALDYLLGRLHESQDAFEAYRAWKRRGK
jgi:hypothetical protein